MKYRRATREDLDLLAEWNHQLIRDEEHRNRMSVSQLRDRLEGWLEGEYEAVLFEIDSEPVVYALYRVSPDGVYLRHLFVLRSHRRKGLGRTAVQILRREVFPDGKRLTVEVLSANTQAVAFWRAVGFSDYCLTLEIMPDSAAADAHDQDSGGNAGYGVLTW